MAQVAPNLEERQEYWKPVIGPRQEAEHAPELAAHACGHCGNELLADATFCPACGTTAQMAEVALAAQPEHVWYDVTFVREARPPHR
jgi:uncharacterized OB-fold protein